MVFNIYSNDTGKVNYDNNDLIYDSIYPITTTPQSSSCVRPSSQPRSPSERQVAEVVIVHHAEVVGVESADQVGALLVGVGRLVREFAVEEAPVGQVDRGTLW